MEKITKLTTGYGLGLKVIVIAATIGTLFYGA